ncbi:hypothetical protein Cfor_12684 [Coptotermes formosanus]|uniref:Uncharacterized protein n=1 Tax=Coptotermes formosanus TaxID=36987 RepID=A0A6L2Q425_COPFO|nr:hypothetical protein Cfor_12684 [Coptotermes formosanus]
MGLILKDTFSVFNFHRICELWCGESNGSISIFTICENIVTSHEIVNHYEPVIENINVLNLVSAHSPLYHEGDDLTVCSYVYPGKVKILHSSSTNCWCLQQDGSFTDNSSSVLSML